MKRCAWARLVLVSLCGAGACDGPPGQSMDAGAAGADGGATDAGGPGPDAGAAVLRIDDVEPDHGPFRGGTEVALRGRGFAAGMTVLVGGRAVEALDLQVVDDRRATLLTPPGMPGLADVRVEKGDLSATRPDGFTYEAIYVDPQSGSVAGGTYVRIKGFGTSFQDGDEVTFDGAPLEGTTVISEQELAGFTPPGVPGDTDVAISGAAGTVEARDAFVYTNTSDPFLGGLGGGPVIGAVNITVLDAMTIDGIEGAYVAAGQPGAESFSGLTDPFGQITFSAPVLAGPLTVTAAAEGYDASSFVVFDASDVTIFLVPRSEPSSGPLPPAPADGVIAGYITFGDATGIGTTSWGLVPEPRTATEVKQARVFTTWNDVFSAQDEPPAGRSATVYYVDDGRTGWGFRFSARPGAFAVVAVAGLFDRAIDPDGAGPLPAGKFSPFAMGVARGVLLGPGEEIRDLAVVIDIPLDSALLLQLDSPPPLDTSWSGPTDYEARAFIDLGGEGVIGLPGSRLTFPPGATSGVLGSMAPLASSIADASYTVLAGASSFGGFPPMSMRVVRGVRDLGSPVVIGEFLGIPRPVDPAMWETATSQHVQFEPEAGTTGRSTFNVQMLLSLDGTMLWRMYTRGDQLDVPIPDLAAAGLPPLPTDELYWYNYQVTIPGLTFDDFNYGQLSQEYWSAWAEDGWVVSFPPAP